MNSNKTNLSSSKEDVSVDLIAMTKKIWLQRKIVIKVTTLFFFFGCFYAVVSPVSYTSQTTFVPQISDDQMSSSKLGSLASLAGLNINQAEMKNDSYLSPLLYTKIIDSEEFSQELLSAELINPNSNKITVRDYLLSKKSSFNLNPIRFIKKYTIGLFQNREIQQIDDDKLKDYNFISDIDYKLILRLRKKFTIDLNAKEGFVKVLATDKSAFISTQLAEHVTKSLQSKIIEIRTNKIRERLEFSKRQYELKQKEFDFLQNKLAEFKDSNKSISTALFLAQLQKLESEYQLQQNILINLASEYNNNKIILNKDTPIFSVIDEVSVPNYISKPRRSTIVLVFIFLGLLFSLVLVLYKQQLINFIKEIRD